MSRVVVSAASTARRLRQAQATGTCPSAPASSTVPSRPPIRDAHRSSHPDSNDMPHFLHQPDHRMSIRITGILPRGIHLSISCTSHLACGCLGRSAWAGGREGLRLAPDRTTSISDVFFSLVGCKDMTQVWVWRLTLLPAAGSGNSGLFL